MVFQLTKREGRVIDVGGGEVDTRRLARRALHPAHARRHARCGHAVHAAHVLAGHAGHGGRHLVVVAGHGRPEVAHPHPHAPPTIQT